MATQMAPAVFDATTVDVIAKSQKLEAKSCLFRANGLTKNSMVLPKFIL